MRENPEVARTKCEERNNDNGRCKISAAFSGISQAKERVMNRAPVILMLLSASFAYTQTPQPEASKAPSAAQVSASQVTAQHGQTEAQKQKDLQECYNIAKAKTGVDPQALMGIAGGSAGTSSSPQAATSGATSGIESAVGSAASGQGAEAAKSSAASNAKTKLDLFGVANQGCVEARGYLVKAPAASTAPAPPQ
jgi:hypothetical protein